MAFGRLILFVFIFSGCDRNKDSQRISYNNLNEIEFQLEMEIGNDSDIFFGELWNLVVGSDGSFVVSDWGKNTIEQFHPDGNHAGTVATEGRGPGELRSQVMLFRGMGDTLIVRQLGMFLTDYFIKESDSEIYSHDRSIAAILQYDRAVMMIGQASDSDYLARTTWDKEIGEMEGKHFGGYSLVPVSIVDNADNILQDSLYILTGPESITLFNDGAMHPMGIPPYKFHDRMRLIEDGSY